MRFVIVLCLVAVVSTKKDNGGSHKSFNVIKQQLVFDQKHLRLNKRQSMSTITLSCSDETTQMKYGYPSWWSGQLNPCTPTMGIDGAACRNGQTQVNSFYECLCCPRYFTLNNPDKCICIRYGA